MCYMSTGLAEHNQRRVYASTYCPLVLENHLRDGDKVLDVWALEALIELAIWQAEIVLGDDGERQRLHLGSLGREASCTSPSESLVQGHIPGSI